MTINDTTYFTGTDAEIRFMTHPAQEWRGHAVDCAYFQLSAGSSPIHIWNYTRRSGTAMSNETQQKQLEKLQKGTQNGAPFDDTAISNERYELQLVLNEDRFKSTYYQFRSMSQIGDIQIKYSKMSGWEERAETGYYLTGGRVGSVGREVNLKESVHPTVELVFEHGALLGEDQTIYSSSNQPFETGAEPGANTAGQAASGIGRESFQDSFTARFYTAWIDGKKPNPRIGNIPDTLRAYDKVSTNYTDQLARTPKTWAQSATYVTPVLTASRPGKETLVYIWNQEENRYEQSALDNAVEVLETKKRGRKSVLDVNDTLPNS